MVGGAANTPPSSHSTQQQIQPNFAAAAAAAQQNGKTFLKKIFWHLCYLFLMIISLTFDDFLSAYTL